MHQSAVATALPSAVSLRRVLACRGIRVLAWDNDFLYACRGYKIIRWRAPSSQARRASDRRWNVVAQFQPAWWRTLTSRSPLTYRLVRDGFHALAVLRDTNERREDRNAADNVAWSRPFPARS